MASKATIETQLTKGLSKARWLTCAGTPRQRPVYASDGAGYITTEKGQMVRLGNRVKGKAARKTEKRARRIARAA